MFELPFSLLLIIFIYLFVLGSCCASFLFVVVHRAAIPQSIPFYKGRSHCDSCGTAGFFTKDVVVIVDAQFLFGIPLVNSLAALRLYYLLWLILFSLLKLQYAC